MQRSLLAFINLVAMLVGLSFLAQAIAQQSWRRGGNGSVILLIVLCGQIWLIPQAIGLFAFHSTRLLYALWFGNWIILAVGVILFCITMRGRSRDLFDAAQMDGLGAFGIFRHVLWPTVKREVIALAILILMATWVEFANAWPAVSAFGPGQLTAPATGSEMGGVVAVSLAATLPAIAIFLYVRRGPDTSVFR
jgi:pectin-derived oligosaccharide transport system permease protein